MRVFFCFYTDAYFRNYFSFALRDKSLIAIALINSFMNKYNYFTNVKLGYDPEA